MHLVEERTIAEDTADALGDAVVALVRAYRRALRNPVAGTLPALELALLLGEGELRLGELATRRGVCQSVVSRQVGELEARGLVVRRPDPADRRAGLVRLTPAGRELLAEAADTRRQWLHDALGRYPTDDVRGATRLVTALADELDHRSTLHGSPSDEERTPIRTTQKAQS
jgi:DNA-binding MarR family transcriptional regulator